MRLLHTSDWHVGRNFHGVSLQAAHAAYIEHLIEVVRSEAIDAVLVAGDIYDRALPSPDSVALLSDAAERITAAGAQLILTSGNHDSPARLGFGAALLERAGLHIRTRADSVARPVLVQEVAIYPLAYLEPRVVAPGWECELTHAAVLDAAMTRIRLDAASRPGPYLVSAHAFVAGGVTSASERDLVSGGVGAVSPTVFRGAAYAALGHLHGPQAITEAVRYSGSPVALSFSEARHRKSTVLLDLDGAGRLRTELVDAPVPRPLAVLRGTLDDLLRDPRHTPAEAAWCQVTLTDPIRPLGAMDRLRARFPHTLELHFEPPAASASLRGYRRRMSATRDYDVCADFVTHVRGGHALEPDEAALLTEAFDAIRGAQAAAETGAGREGIGAA